MDENPVTRAPNLGDPVVDTQAQPDQTYLANPQVQTEPYPAKPSADPILVDPKTGSSTEVCQPSAPAIDEQALRKREEDVARREDVLNRRMERRREVHTTELTDKDVEAQVIAEYSACAWDAFGSQPNIDTVAERALRSTTICVLITRNGFPIVGTSTAISPDNYDHNDGLKWSKQDAMAKLWLCCEYANRNRIMGLEPVEDDLEPPATGDLAEPWPPRRAVA